MVSSSETRSGITYTDEKLVNLAAKLSAAHSRSDLHSYEDALTLNKAYDEVFELALFDNRSISVINLLAGFSCICLFFLA